MPIRVATCNANNLFSRWSFQAELPGTVAPGDLPTLHGEAGNEVNAGTADDPVSEPGVVQVRLADDTVLAGVLRTFRGKLVRGKDPKARAWLARRIAVLNADVLCLQAP
jgi:hypothetical protein